MISLRFFSFAATPIVMAATPNAVARHALEDAGHRILTFVLVASLVEILTLLPVIFYVLPRWPALRRWRKEALGVASLAGGLIGVLAGARISGLFA
jgi:hypothetical protein